MGECMQKGPEELRAGVAEICAARREQHSFSTLCFRALATLFSDTSEVVRQLAAVCFDNFEKEQIASAELLVDIFVNSSSFGEGVFEGSCAR